MKFTKGTIVKMLGTYPFQYRITPYGTIIGHTRKQDCVRVQWDDRSTSNSVPLEYIREATPAERRCRLKAYVLLGMVNDDE